MGFDDQLKRELKALIRDVVRDELKSLNMESGVNSADRIANHKWLKLQRERADKASTAFVLAMATAIAGGLATALWVGLKQLVHVQK